MTKIRFPILKNIEYIDIIKNKTVLRSYKGKDLEGLKWRELQNKIGLEVGTDLYHFVLKAANTSETYQGLVRGIKEDQIIDSTQSETIELKTKIDNLTRSLNQAQHGGGISVETLLNVTKQSFENQISFLNLELTRKENLINRLETKLENYETDLNECQENSKSSSGIAQYIEMAQTFLKLKQGNLEPITNLKESNSSDIPKEILEILGMVDYSKINPDDLNSILYYLKVFIQKLPLKGN